MDCPSLEAGKSFVDVAPEHMGYWWPSGRMVGLDDLRGLLQPSQYSDFLTIGLVDIDTWLGLDKQQALLP